MSTSSRRAALAFRLVAIQSLAIIRREAEDTSERFVRTPLDQLAPRRAGIFAYPDHGAAIRRHHLRHPHLKIVVGVPAGNVARILRVHLQLACRQVETVDVKQTLVALIGLHQQRVWLVPLVGDDRCLHFVKGSEICGLPSGDIGLVNSPVFVAVGVLRVENVQIVILPRKSMNAALVVRGHRAIVVLAQGADPDVQHIIHRSQIGKLGAVGRQRRAGALGIAEQDGAWN